MDMTVMARDTLMAMAVAVAVAVVLMQLTTKAAAILAVLLLLLLTIHLKFKTPVTRNRDYDRDRDRRHRYRLPPCSNDRPRNRSKCRSPSKRRTSGFDMAPPVAAMLPGSAVPGRENLMKKIF